MAQKKKRIRREEAESSRIRRATRAIRNTSSRKMRTAPKVKVQENKRAVNAAPKPDSPQKSAGVNRSEGIRLFKLAGRPTTEQFVLVYGERGPKMTWEQRAAAGLPAEKFQAALVSAMRHRK
jgi:hypothetical protein